MKTALPTIRLPKTVTEAKLARKSGVPQATLNLILHGKRRAHPLTARSLAKASEVLCLPMSLYDWLYPEDSTSVLVQHTQQKEEA